MFLAIATLKFGPFTPAVRYSILLGAVVVASLGFWLNRGERAPDGKQRHLLYGIPMQWYSLIWILLFISEVREKGLLP